MQKRALQWFDQGVVPVPLKARSKEPALPWGRLQTEWPPRALVARWFEDERNLGLVCGSISGGLVVLDFDQPLFYWRWARMQAELRCSYTVRTARGWHVYLRMRHVPGGTSRMEGGEIKASGYVVASGSVHPGGAVYRDWVGSGPTDILSVRDAFEAGWVLFRRWRCLRWSIR